MKRLEDFLEKTRLVKIGLFGADGERGQIMWTARFVSAFVKVSADFARCRVFDSEKIEGNPDGQFPADDVSAEFRGFGETQNAGVLPG